MLDAVSIPDSAAIPLVAQPEMEATNGKSLLKFKWVCDYTLLKPVSLIFQEVNH